MTQVNLETKLTYTQTAVFIVSTISPVGKHPNWAFKIIGKLLCDRRDLECAFDI